MTLVPNMDRVNQYADLARDVRARLEAGARLALDNAND
jgi:hypothetical protein